MLFSFKVSLVPTCFASLVTPAEDGRLRRPPARPALNVVQKVLTAPSGGCLKHPSSSLPLGLCILGHS
jgi:hypothetical protein